MRPIFLVINSMVFELGMDRVAGSFGVSGAMVYKYGEDPDESGKDIPLRHLIKLLELSGLAPHNYKLQNDLDELLSHFAIPAKRRIIREDGILDLETAVHALKGLTNGRRYEGSSLCPTCGNPLTIISKDRATLVYSCRTCLGKGGINA